jgi:ankyrin repeat protein
MKLKHLLESPPDRVPPTSSEKMNTDYRKSPYIIQAAVAGNIPIFKMLSEAGCKITDIGHICLSKKRKNSVISTVVGAAAFSGKNELLKYLLANQNLKGYIEHTCTEQQDIKPIKAGPLTHEYHGYTPLQLAIVSPYSDMETVQLLLQSKANTKVLERDTGNNLIHLAALYCTNNDIFNYVVKNVNLDLFARNKQGETLASIVKQGNDKERHSSVEQLLSSKDKSKQEADLLLKELLEAEEKEAA